MMKLGRGLAAVAVAAGLGAGAVLLPSAPALAKDSAETQPMHRLYNPNSGEHFYTASAGERDALVRVGWRYEGEGWTAPAKSATPVYRLYNPNAGDHHYTTSAGERDSLKRAGWNYEGIGWYGSDAKAVPLYRQYNPNARTGTHNYTTSAGERDHLVRLGWRDEGVGWYGVETNAEPSDVEAQGQFGEGCTWRLHRGGELEVLPTDGRSGTMGVLNKNIPIKYLTKVTSIVVDKGVKAPADSAYLFSPYYYDYYTEEDLLPFTSIDVSNLDVSDTKNMRGVFCGCTKVTSIKGLDAWDVSNVTNTSHMFAGCWGVTSIKGLGAWDVSNVTDMTYMFLYCSSLSDATSLNSWTLSSSVDTSAMFDGCAEGIKTPSWYYKG